MTVPIIVSSRDLISFSDRALLNLGLASAEKYNEVLELVETALADIFEIKMGYNAAHLTQESQEAIVFFLLGKEGENLLISEEGVEILVKRVSGKIFHIEEVKFSKITLH